MQQEQLSGTRRLPKSLSSPRYEESRFVEKLYPQDDKPHPVDNKGLMMNVVPASEATKLEKHRKIIDGQNELYYLVQFPDLTCQEQLFQVRELERFVRSRFALLEGKVFVTWQLTWVPACCVIAGSTNSESQASKNNSLQNRQRVRCPVLSNPRACLHELLPKLLNNIFLKVKNMDLLSFFNVYQTCQKFAKHLEPQVREILEVHAEGSITPEVWEFRENRQIVRRVNAGFSDVEGIFFREVRFPNPFLFTTHQTDPKNVWANHYYRNNTNLVLGHSVVELQKIYFAKPNAKFISPRGLLLCHPPVTTVVASIRVYQRPNGIETIAASWRIRNEAGVQLEDVLSKVIAPLPQPPDDRLPMIGIHIPGAVCPTPEEVALINQTGSWEALRKAVIGTNPTCFGPVSDISVEEVQQAFGIGATAGAVCQNVMQYFGDGALDMRAAWEVDDSDGADRRGQSDVQVER